MEVAIARDLLEQASGAEWWRPADDRGHQAVPRRAAGLCTVWRAGEFGCAGLSGRGAQREDFAAPPGEPARSGRRLGYPDAW
jgi:hypothetical protein